jgi:hypothetical protein
MKSIRQIINGLAVCGLAFLFTGCASYYCGRNQTLPITSDPQKAAVTVYNEFNDVVFEGTTPCSVNLRRADDQGDAVPYRIVIELDGHVPQEIVLAGRVNRAYCINLMNGGVGYVVDAINGSKWTLTPCEVRIQLEEQKTVAARNARRQTFAVTTPRTNPL